MTLVNIFKSPDFQTLFQDFETLEKINTDQGDKLAVHNGILEISPGGILQALIRTFKNLRYGGYNRDTVVLHLEKMARKTQTFIMELQEDPHYLDYGNEFRQLVKTLKKVSSALSCIEYSYRDIKAFPAYKDLTCDKLSVLYRSFSSISKSLKEEFKSKEWKNLQAPQKKPLDLKNAANLEKIKLDMPSGQTPEETLELAKAAERQIVPLWKKVGSCVLAIFATLVLVLPLSSITFIKWTVWNPIEFALKGKITTQSPLNWWMKSAENAILMPTFLDDSKEAVRRYASQLLRTPIITEAHVKAFCELAPYVKEVELFPNGLGSKNIDELWSMIEDIKFNSDTLNKSIFGKYALECLSQWVEQSTLKIITASDFYFALVKFQRQLQWIDNPQNLLCKRPKDKEWNDEFSEAQKAGYENTAEDRKRYFMDKLSKENPFNTPDDSHSRLISLSGLFQIISAIGKNSECHKIKLPLDSEKITAVQEALSKYGFRQNPKHSWEYTR